MVLFLSAKCFKPTRASILSTIILRDLIPSRLVLVKVVFPIKIATSAYRAIQRKGGTNCWYEGRFLEFLPSRSVSSSWSNQMFLVGPEAYWLASGESEVEQRDMGVRWIVDGRCRSFTWSAVCGNPACNNVISPEKSFRSVFS